MVKSMRRKKRINSKKRKHSRRIRGGNDQDIQSDNEFMSQHKLEDFYNPNTKTYKILSQAHKLNYFPNVDNIPKETRLLFLTGNNISEIPDSIGELTNLVMIAMGKNRINKISPEIGKLTKLRKISLEHNKLESLPPEIGLLTNLEELILGGNNKLLTLPPEIGMLTNLKKLDLNHDNQKTLLPEIGNLTKLEELDLTHNNLTTLPPEIGMLTNLKILNLNFNGLTELPPEIGLLTNLEKLDIKYNRLTTIPLELTKLPKLTIVNLDNNNYKWFDDTVIEKFGEKLGKYPRPMPNQKWKSHMGARDYYKQSQTTDPLVKPKLNKDVSTHIFSFFHPQEQNIIFKDLETKKRVQGETVEERQTKRNRNININTGGRKRKTRKAHRR
jgi:Leucine-rich repeat (LRR) protein